jgi:hypothetical protein
MKTQNRHNSAGRTASVRAGGASRQPAGDTGGHKRSGVFELLVVIAIIAI